MNVIVDAENRIIGGCRLLRVIGRGTASTVWVGIDADGAQIAVKVLDDSGGGHGDIDADGGAEVDLGASRHARRLGRELEALHRAAGDHVVQLLDLDTCTEATALFFERLPGGDLAQLLARRARIEAGEAVTVLAPLAATVQRMHLSGVAHGSLHPGRVLFRGDGAPVLVGFGRAGLFAAAAPEVVLEADAAVASDRAALVAMAAAVLGRVVGSREKVAGQLLARFAAAPPARVAELMATAVFELATPIPVRFVDDREDLAPPGGGARAVPLVAPGGGDGRSDADTAYDSLAPALPVPRLFRPDGPLAAALEHGPGSTARAAIARRWRSWTAARKRLLLAAAAGVAALSIAVVVVPGPSAPTAPGVSEPSSLAGDGDAEGGAAADGDSVLPAEVSEASGPDATTADDPVMAVPALLERRDRCFADLSLLCLDGVDLQNSAAMDDDYAVIEAGNRGAELPTPIAVDPAVVIVVERLGDSALLDLGPDSDPASLLLMKSEAGWRIRDYIAAGG